MSHDVDASKLPDHAFGSRSLLWWGTMAFIVIEGVIFAVLIATYLYGMGRASSWPPSGRPPELFWGGLTTLLLLLSFWPSWRYKRAAEQRDMRTVRLWLLMAIGLEAVVLVVRTMEFMHLEVHWTTNFYGSILWCILGLHTLHILSDFIEIVVLYLIGRRPEPVPHAFRDLSESALYRFFAIAVWLPLFGLIYLLPYGMASP